MLLHKSSFSLKPSSLPLSHLSLTFNPKSFAARFVGQAVAIAGDSTGQYLYQSLRCRISQHYTTEDWDPKLAGWTGQGFKVKLLGTRVILVDTPFLMEAWPDVEVRIAAVEHGESEWRRDFLLWRMVNGMAHKGAGHTVAPTGREAACHMACGHAPFLMEAWPDVEVSVAGRSYGMSVAMGESKASHFWHVQLGTINLKILEMLPPCFQA
ncbi:unnamed protein product [Closterium sp. NIES-64]|nr:unnamed protein product [Closterium sp. NIES-64]CAI6004308.1 unnamed protein product [Closterium sp. NIES-64]